MKSQICMKHTIEIIRNNTETIQEPKDFKQTRLLYILQILQMKRMLDMKSISLVKRKEFEACKWEGCRFN